ncbi:hypothetical protein COU80_05940, partial [Candidatus Peregrinibacteria bacterium CG10_big_fil_rev_8_21_14_0_10_55_24]
MPLRQLLLGFFLTLTLAVVLQQAQLGIEHSAQYRAQFDSSSWWSSSSDPWSSSSSDPWSSSESSSPACTDPCSDGNTCTTGDHCVGDVCTGTPLDCSHLNSACTVGVCDQASGCIAQHLPNGVSCNDFNPCTLGDTCQSGICVPGSEVTSCDDGNACTSDSQECNPALGGCTHVPVSCWDGTYCTGEWCDQTAGCIYEPVPVPCGEYPDTCTQEYCTEENTCPDGSMPSDCCVTDSDCSYLDDPPDAAPDNQTQCWAGKCEDNKCVADIVNVCDAVVTYDNCCELLQMPLLFLEELDGSTTGQQNGGEFVEGAGDTGYYPSGNGHILLSTYRRINPEAGAVCVTVRPLHDQSSEETTDPEFFFSEEGNNAHLRLWSQHISLNNDQLMYSKQDGVTVSEIGDQWLYAPGFWSYVAIAWDGEEQQLSLNKHLLAREENLYSLTDVGPEFSIGNHPNPQKPTTSTEFVIGEVAICGEPLPLEADLSVGILPWFTQVQPGDVAQYTVSVNNAGPDAASAVVLVIHVDPLSGGWQPIFQSSASDILCTVVSSGDVECSLGTMMPSATESVSITYALPLNVEAPQDLTIEASVHDAAATFDPLPGNNTEQSTLAILPLELPECDDRVDNDGDGLADYPDDPGCADPGDDDESDGMPVCSDNMDNDGDSSIDYGADSQCLSALDGSEECKTAYLTWQEAGTDVLPYPLSNHAALAYGDALWLIGGLQGSGDGSPPIASRNVLRSVDGELWSELVEVLPAGLSHSAAVDFNGAIIVLGGLDAQGEPTDAVLAGEGTAFTPIASLPVPLWSHTAMVYQGDLWVIGGQTQASGGFSRKVWRSSDAYSWQEVDIDSLPKPLAGHASAVFDGRLWVLGGRETDEAGPVSAAAYWSDDGIFWRQAGGLLTEERSGLSAQVFQNRLWAIGGTSTDAACEMTHDGSVWYAHDPRELLPHTNTTNHASVVYQNQVWLVGGEDPTGVPTRKVFLASLTDECLPECGDSVREDPEECDDSNAVSGDGCSDLCVVEQGWECPDTGGCTEICNDGLIVGNEACDDASGEPQQGCVEGYYCLECSCNSLPSCDAGCVQLTEEECVSQHPDWAWDYPVEVAQRASLFGRMLRFFASVLSFDQWLAGDALVSQATVGCCCPPLQLPNTMQLHYRWRDDTTVLNTDGGWMALEDVVLTDAHQGTTYRLRIEAANASENAEMDGRQYQVQFAPRVTTCSVVSNWIPVPADGPDEALQMAFSNQVTDGQILLPGLLADSEGYFFVGGRGVTATSNATTLVGPLDAGTYTELEYAINITEHAAPGTAYCLRLYDVRADVPLDAYALYPKMTIASQSSSSSSSTSSTSSTSSATSSTSTTSSTSSSTSSTSSSSSMSSATSSTSTTSSTTSSTSLTSSTSSTSSAT